MAKLIIALLLILGLLGGYWYFKNQLTPVVTNFEQCVLANNPVMESYPRRCQAKNGQTFTEDIGNELEKNDLIQIETPRPNSTVSSPIIVRGKARGNWFFEASFPIKLIDDQGQEIGTAIATADGEWMTEDFVPFSATLSFSTTSAKTGKLILAKDNPSGLPENDDYLEVPVNFTWK